MAERASALARQVLNDEFVIAVKRSIQKSDARRIYRLLELGIDLREDRREEQTRFSPALGNLVRDDRSGHAAATIVARGRARNRNGRNAQLVADDVVIVLRGTGRVEGYLHPPVRCTRERREGRLR